MILLHLSDLHTSRFGSRMVEIAHGPARVARGEGWTTAQDLPEGWRVEARRAEGRALQLRDALRLVDDQGKIHQTLKIKGDLSEADALARLRDLAGRRRQTHWLALANDLPTPQRVAELLQHDPANTNLRFCRLAWMLRQEPADLLLITGDLTDDGDGYELIQVALQPLIDAGRVLALPGNHDLYPAPPLWTARELRKPESDKLRAWGRFASHLGIPAVGSFLREIAPGVLLACVNSCHRPAVPASASGAVPNAHLQALSGALDAAPRDATRLVALHHHVVNLPANGLGLPPFQPGMRLRNAREVLDWLRRERIDAVFNGHRHIGYRYQPSEGPLFLSAPSSTSGCRSGADPYLWRVEVDHRGLQGVTPLPVR